MGGRDLAGAEVKPVIIVGAGPVGLGAALELARCGLRSILIERNERTSWHPKTRNFNTRTMEIARGWGREIYDELRHLDLPPNWKSPIRFLDSVVGKETGHVVSKGFAGAGPDLSPVSSVLSSQDMLEPVMLREIKRTGMVDIRMGHELVEIVRGHEDDATSVEVKVRNKATGEIYKLEAPALVASDGAASFVRDFLQVPLDGPMKIAHFINCYYRADIEKYICERDRSGILLFVSNSRAMGVFQPLDAKGRWLSQIQVPEDQWSTDIFTPERCVQWVRDGVGVPDLEVEVRSVGKWQMNAVVGRRLISGRILLTGDAAHMFPPTGGLGANTGVQGMHNAIWKLALFLKGKAGRKLLQTYETERRPVARWVADQSYHNRQQVNKLGAISRGEVSADGMGPQEVLQATRRYGNHIGLELGTIYTSEAVVADGSKPPEVEDAYTDYVPSGHPGARAPHVWLDRGQERLSTIDLAAPEFSIIAGSQGQGWRKITEAAGRHAHLDMPCHVIGDGLVDVESTFTTRFGVSDTGAVLVRPDGFIAWRAHELGPNAARDLGNALTQILS
ncbi:MAG: FAD-dependent monooxygenase [Rhizobiales bacterium]|nr:FAD-dependent monooxygenase [Hyphomicrobiales bacterium]